MLHVVAGCVAGHVAGRSGWPSLALAVGVAVAELECLLRQLALSEYDGKARAVAQAMRSPNKACIAELAQQLQGVDRLRIDRAEGNFLNVLLTDALWPATCRACGYALEVLRLLALLVQKYQY